MFNLGSEVRETARRILMERDARAKEAKQAEARALFEEQEAKASEAKEAEAKALFDEKEAKAKKAAAALLAELDAEDRLAAAAAEKKKSKRKATKRKGLGLSSSRGARQRLSMRLPEGAEGWRKARRAT